jgi:hypothetical protein
MISFSFIAGLLTLFAPAQPAPDWPAVRLPVRPAPPVVISKSGHHDFGGSIRLLGVIPHRVREYGTPALHVRADRVTLKNFAWRGSMEGVHAGSEPFTPRGMRQRHRPIRVTLSGLVCDDVGEDAIEIQPRSHVVIRNSRFRGNHRRLPTDDPDVPGLDKIAQIDSAHVVFEGCDFFNGVSCVRAKTNSRVVLRNCRFIDCSTCVSGDGLACPRPGHPFDNGQPGLCKITLIDCQAWNSKLLARAYPGCEIELINCRMHGGGRLSREDGGQVRKWRNLHSRSD